MSKKHPLNKPVAIRLAMDYSGLMTSRQKEKMVMDAEVGIRLKYIRLLSGDYLSKKETLRSIAVRIAFINLVKGDDYCKVIMYRTMVSLEMDGLIKIRREIRSGRPNKKAYFFAQRKTKRPKQVTGSQVSFWMGESGLHARRGYE